VHRSSEATRSRPRNGVSDLPPEDLCLTDKMVVLLNIKDLTPITWTEDMFENLVLPVEEKQLLLALTRSHAKQNSKFDDFVVGKGSPNLTSC
jgi:hypothetical protein